MTIADLSKDHKDAAGDTVIVMYGYKPPTYAVYGTQTRVTVQFADAINEESDQRKAMASLNPLRGEINGLIDGWRFASFPSSFKRKALRYDRRVADALVVALEDDIGSADAILKAVKQDIIDERTAWARLEYLAAALVLSLLTIGIADHMAGDPTIDLWRAAAAGAIGAFFSIALAIRGRTILTDLHRTSNLMDAAVRTTIGIIAAVVLMALVSAHVVKLTFGDGQPGQLADQPWLLALIIGFIGGFSERLVPDLLAKAGYVTQTPPVPLPPLSPLKPNATPASGAPQAPAAPPIVVDEAPDTLPQEADLDHCLCNIHVSDAEATPDDQLPAATGGVESDASGDGKP